MLLVTAVASYYINVYKAVLYNSIKMKDNISCPAWSGVLRLNLQTQKCPAQNIYFTASSRFLRVQLPFSSNATSSSDTKL